MDKIKELTDELKHHLSEARAIAAKADEENRDFTDTERGAITEAMAKANGLKARLEQAKADGAVRQAITDLGDGIGLNAKDGTTRTPTGLIVPDGRKSIGQHFTTSAEYAALMAGAPNGHFGEKARVQSMPVGFKSLLTGASDTSAGALVMDDRRGLLVGADAFQRPLVLRDVVTPGTTASDTIEFVRMTAATNAAAPVAEATATTGTSGTKPESGMTWAKVTTPVRTIAHWLPLTKRALSDAAQILTIIDSYLRYGLEEELEDQMIAGDGTGENFTGLANTSGVQAPAFTTETNLTRLRRGKTLVKTVGRSMANAYVMNPADVEGLDLLTDNEARFYFGGPSGSSGGNIPLWNLPIVESEAVPAGTAYVGDWRKAILWDREQASITMTDSHSDFFVRNMVAVLAEMRCAFGIIQPNAFVKIPLAAW
ncbi:phage major capsid protein [Kitasatospora sp. NPDC101235]|uniref:phage major capsid protein n=1 Tax=Kitasatospora sp. NPDC101235 TaxID=3364101 RepID=UPI0038215E92